MRPFLLVLMVSVIFGPSVNAQNYLLEMFHPKNKEVKKLRTDSMYIHSSGSIRRLYFEYTDKNALTKSNDFWYSDKMAPVQRYLKKHIQDGNIFTVETEVQDGNKKTIRKERYTETRRPDGQPDSAITYIDRNGVWEPAQKMAYAYNTKNYRLSRLDQVWNPNKGTWMSQWGETMEYDSKNRLRFRRNVQWDAANSRWLISQEYGYDYENGGNNQPVSLTWRTLRDSTMQNITKLETAFNSTGKKDTVILYRWNVDQEDWVRDHFTLLDNNDHRQLFELGDKYYRNDSNLWEKSEETSYMTGTGIYSDEAEGMLVQIYDKKEEKWRGISRETTQYTDMPDGKRVYGRFEKEGNGPSDALQQEILVEAWFTKKDPEKPGPIDDRSNTRENGVCSLPNPFMSGLALTLPQGNETPVTDGNTLCELRITSEDGRLVWHRTVQNASAVTIDANLTPGVYLLTVLRDGQRVCVQKLLSQ